MFKKFKKILFISLLLSFFLTDSLAYSDSDNTDKHQENVNVLKNALNAAKLGPTTVSLIDQATLDIPENYLYVPVIPPFLTDIKNRELSSD